MSKKMKIANKPIRRYKWMLIPMKDDIKSNLFPYLFINLIIIEYLNVDIDISCLCVQSFAFRRMLLFRLK
jgi:hypothetical protein